MGLFDLLQDPQHGAAIDQIARQVGLNPDQAQAALQHLTPAISRGIQNQASAQGGLESILDMLQNGGHQKHLDDPGAFGRPAAIDAGNNVLGQIFGSKDVSRQVADHVSQQSGIGADIIRKMLPLVATMVMGAVAKNALGGGNLDTQSSSGGLGSLLNSVIGGGGAPSSGGLGGLLTSMLGGAGGASPFDQILGGRR